jgi:DNA-binding PadR family transcriptional regulator
MYELLVLALLTHWPMHAYLLADIANDIIGPWEKISRGTLSSLLTKLEEGGYIEAADPATVPFPSSRPARAVAITAAGRDRLRKLMLDTTSNSGTYKRLFRIKALHLHLLSAEDRLFLIDHYIHYCQTGVRHQRAEAQDFAARTGGDELTNATFGVTALELMDLEARQWELELVWARGLRERASGDAGGDGAPAPG